MLYPRVFLDWVERKREHGEHLTVLPTVFFHGMGLGREIHLETEPGQGLVVRLSRSATRTPRDSVGSSST